MREKDLKKVSYATETGMPISCIWLLFELGGHCYPYTIKTSSVLLCVRIPVTSQTQIATVSSIYLCYKCHF